MRIDWSPLDAALERASPVFWWRDDDAVEPTPPLERLLCLTESIGAPLLIASIPAYATVALADRLQGLDVTVGTHGFAHVSHAPDGQKKAEFGAHRPLAALAADAKAGKARIDAMFGDLAAPIFIPPWNRMMPELAKPLATLGFEAFSAYAQRTPSVEPLVRLDALIDPIEWRGSRSAVSPDPLIRHVAELLESDAPIGLMTHHLVHDDSIWELTGAVVRRVTERGAHWKSASEIVRALSP